MLDDYNTDPQERIDEPVLGHNLHLTSRLQTRKSLQPGRLCSKLYSMGYSKNNITIQSVSNPSHVIISTPKIRFYIGIATLTLFQFLLWPTSGYSLTHPLEYLVGYFTVVILPTTVLAGAAIYLIENRWPDRTKAARIRQANIKRQETLKNRVQSDGTFSALQNLGERLILHFVVPSACFLDRHFGNVRWVHEYMGAVARRYLVLPISQAMEYPDRKNGYFLHIVDYIWQDDGITFVFEPSVGIVRARKTISRRLEHYDKQCIDQVKYKSTGNKLLVTIPHKLCGIDPTPQHFP